MKGRWLVIVALLGMVLLLSSCVDQNLPQTIIKAKVEAIKIQAEIQKSISTPQGIEGEMALKVTEFANNEAWKYTWKLTFKNNRKKPVLLTAEIQFQDKDGFEIDYVSKHDLCVNANEEKPFTGSWFINPSEEVSRIYVKVISQNYYIYGELGGQEFRECNQVSNK